MVFCIMQPNAHHLSQPSKCNSQSYTYMTLLFVALVLSKAVAAPLQVQPEWDSDCPGTSAAGPPPEDARLGISRPELADRQELEEWLGE